MTLTVNFTPWRCCQNMPWMIVSVPLVPAPPSAAVWNKIRKGVCMCVRVCLYVCVCVCVWEAASSNFQGRSPGRHVRIWLLQRIITASVISHAGLSIRDLMLNVYKAHASEMYCHSGAWCGVISRGPSCVKWTHHGEFGVSTTSNAWEVLRKLKCVVYSGGLQAITDQTCVCVCV